MRMEIYGPDSERERGSSVGGGITFTGECKLLNTSKINWNVWQWLTDTLRGSLLGLSILTLFLISLKKIQKYSKIKYLFYLLRFSIKILILWQFRVLERWGGYRVRCSMPELTEIIKIIFRYETF